MSIDKILQLGDDQMASQFQLIFPNGIPGGGDPEYITYRLDNQFDPPKREVQVYDVWSQGQKVTQAGVTEATDKRFTLPIRLDQGWKAYDGLDNWFKLSYDEENGGSKGTNASSRVPMVIQALGVNKVVVKQLTWLGVKCIGLKITAFDQQSNEPLKVEGDFIYLKFRNG